jgi:uncharacterized RDD family membrane protein YckC
MTLPVILYFGIMESSKWGASLGKRIVGLRVCTDLGGRLSLRRAIIRNGIKFAPWEIGHLVAQQAFYSGDAGMQSWIYGPVFLSMALPIWWVVSLLKNNFAPYDRWAGVRIDRSSG